MLPTASIYLTTAGGERKQAVSASCSIRPGKGVTLSVEVLDSTLFAEDSSRDEVCAAVEQFLHEELDKAAKRGLPVSTAEPK